MKKLTQSQLRAFSKLSRGWQSATEINEKQAMLDSLVRVGLAEREIRVRDTAPKRGVVKYRMFKTRKKRKTLAQRRDLAKQAAWKPNYEKTPQWIVCAAMRKNGRIIAGPRHFSKVMRDQMEAAEGLKWWQSCEQGFIDQFGDFISREVAWKIAKRNGQLLPRDSTPGTLYSETLY